MKKSILLPLSICAVLAFAGLLLSCTNDDGVITKKNGVYTIDTTTLTAEVKGYNGPTPLLITVKDNKIVKVEALENSETPKFFERMCKAGMLDRWNGMTVEEALNSNVDVVAGATYSSNAVVENVRIGLEYYKNKVKK